MSRSQRPALLREPCTSNWQLLKREAAGPAPALACPQLHGLNPSRSMRIVLAYVGMKQILFRNSQQSGGVGFCPLRTLSLFAKPLLTMVQLKKNVLDASDINT